MPIIDLGPMRPSTFAYLLERLALCQIRYNKNKKKPKGIHIYCQHLDRSPLS